MSAAFNIMLLKIVHMCNNEKGRREYVLLCGIVHFGASNDSLAFLADKSRAPAYARVSAAIGVWTLLKINTILIIVSIILGIFSIEIA
jgi:hypothetical protein